VIVKQSDDRGPFGKGAAFTYSMTVQGEARYAGPMNSDFFSRQSQPDEYIALCGEAKSGERGTAPHTFRCLPVPYTVFGYFLPIEFVVLNCIVNRFRGCESVVGDEAPDL
jgi:hypothetical protein